MSDKNNFYAENFENLKNLMRTTSGDKNGQALFDFLVASLQPLISSTDNEQELIDDFSKYLQYSDIKYFTIKSILDIVKSGCKNEIKNDIQSGEQKSEHQIDVSSKENGLQMCSTNAAKLLLLVKLPIGHTERGEKELTNMRSLVLDDQFKFNYESASKMYTDAWQILLSSKLSFDSYKKILAAMDTKILPHFKSPLNLTDFLINSFKIGGSVSLLSLSSLFLLITKYNLDYPDFYTNFYSLVTPEILHVKYRSRFLYWTDIFLSSTNLPAYVVAAFIKKFSRLALIASVETLYSLIPLIVNLLIRHPNLCELFNKHTDLEQQNDPFRFEEANLKETRAQESSLWELKSLQKHWNSRVRQEAKFIDFTLPKDEFDLSDLLDTDFSQLIDDAFSKSIDNNDLELNISVGESALEFFD